MQAARIRSHNHSMYQGGGLDVADEQVLYDYNKYSTVYTRMKRTRTHETNVNLPRLVSAAEREKNTENNLLIFYNYTQCIVSQAFMNCRGKAHGRSRRLAVATCRQTRYLRRTDISADHLKTLRIRQHTKC